MKTKHIILIAGAAALLIAGVLLNLFLQSSPAGSAGKKTKQEKEVNTIILGSGNNKYFDDPAIVVTDTAGKTRPFSSIEGKVLFFRVRSTDRKTDYGAEIERLKHFAAGGKHYKSIALLVSFTNSQSIDSLQQTYHIPFAVYQVDAAHLGKVPFERVPLPYYFVQEEDKSISHLSIPASLEPEQIEKYYQGLGLPTD